MKLTINFDTREIFNNGPERIRVKPVDQEIEVGMGELRDLIWSDKIVIETVEDDNSSKLGSEN